MFVEINVGCMKMVNRCIHLLSLASLAVIYLTKFVDCVDCYACQFTGPATGDLFCLQTDREEYPDNSVISGCAKCLLVTGKLGDNVHILRGCVRQRQPLAGENNGCWREDGDRSVTKCLCASNHCNLKTPATRPPPSSAPDNNHNYGLIFCVTLVASLLT